MVLVDTSVWVDHLRSGNPRLASLLDREEVVCHPYIIGELACGNLPNREETLGLMRNLPQAAVTGHDEVMRFIEFDRLMGIGLGYIDVHLLASARLTMTPLWTMDLPLRKAAAKLEILFP
ncbi:MAG: type II toxin-antitoxin system VapC family toxin [Candidatus Aminicenantales bacterium]